jgi:hypothetical protein
MRDTPESFSASKYDTYLMQFHLFGCSVLAGAVGCILFQVGGFLLFPVALDLWYRAIEASKQPASEPVDSD